MRKFTVRRWCWQANKNQHDECEGKELPGKRKVEAYMYDKNIRVRVC